MKKLSTILMAAFFAAFMLTSCETVQVAKFTSVENLYQLKLNSSLESAIATLGSKPYNILSNQVDGYVIYTYKYKLVERKVNPDLINERGGETTGTDVYNGKEQTVFLFFKNDRLEALITTDGRKDSPALIMLNNTLYTISKDRDKYVIVPTTMEEPKDMSLPFGNKKSKKSKSSK